MRYQALCSISDPRLHLICGENEAFADLPNHIRYKGPWQVKRRGEIDLLKPEYRQALARLRWLNKSGETLRGRNKPVLLLIVSCCFKIITLPNYGKQ